MQTFALLFRQPQHPSQSRTGDAVSQNSVAIGQQFGGELPTAPGDFIAALDFAVHEAQHGFGLPRRFANLEGLWDEMMQIVGGGARGDQTLGGGAQVLAPEGRQRQP